MVLKSAQLLLEEVEAEEEVCPVVGGGVVIGRCAEVVVTRVAACKLIGASLLGIRSA